MNYNQKNMKTKIAVCALVALLSVSVPPNNQSARAQVKAPADALGGDIITITSGVAVNGVSRGGRVPFAPDVVQNLVVRGEWRGAKAGDRVAVLSGTAAPRAWEAIKADADGWFTGNTLSGGGYLYATVDAPEERTCLLEATGDSMVYVNGEPRAGDPYLYGSLRLPVRLRKGANTFLFATGRGRLRARLLPIAAPVQWNTDDATLPDLRAGETKPLLLAVPLINATDRTLTGLTVQARIGNGATVETVLPALPPMTVRKVGFRAAPPATLTGETATVQISVAAPPGANIPDANATLTLRIRKPGETYKETFQSGIDDSVQYFAVNPARAPSPANALVLSLHGARVEATGQADAYAPKDWATLIAPTNRRPFGFDWEDWGRLDALEVWARARAEFPHDPARVFLTGHSMGGHGTWSLGSLFPDQFAVIGPSAGWISFATYAGSPSPQTPAPDALTSLVNRAANQHDTLAWDTNLLQERIYLIHGDADDNVPVMEARRMRARLAAMHHPAVEWHEEKGAGHWWDDPKTPGAECVDWRPLWARFETERLKPGEWNDMDFITVNPAISASDRWVRIEQQERSLLPSRVRLAWNRGDGSVTGTTQNVAALTILGARAPGDTPLRFAVIDDQRVELSGPRARGDRTLRRDSAGKWRIMAKPIATEEKTPERGGPFKQAFQNRFILVYGTGGSAAENRASYGRARFDAEAFLYRGNASPELIADRDYDVSAMRDRSVIVYGNADTNRLWNTLLKNSPVQVRRGKVRFGNREATGENLACVFLRPKPGSRVASVGVVGATGAEGARLTERLSYFTSGAAFPDWVIADTSVLTNARQGVVAAGYFGNDWRLETGEFAGRSPGR